MRRNWLAQTGIAALPVVTIAGVSTIAWRLGSNLATASVLLVLLVVLTAHKLGFVTATVASIAAVSCLNFFFVPPALTFVVADTGDFIALLAFEACALVVSRLSAKANLEARAARKERQDLERLYAISRQMLLIDLNRPAAAQIVTVFHRELDCQAVALFDGDRAQFENAGELSPEMEAMTRSAYFARKNQDDADGRVRYRVLQPGAQARGALALRWAAGHDDGSAAMVNALVSLASIGLERARSFESESRALGARHTEQLRTAVLDSLAHSFKTPLTAIQTASSGLLALGPSDPAMRDLASLIEEEAASLSAMTTELLRTAKLDGAEASPRREAISLADLRVDMAELAAKAAPGREFELQFADVPGFARGDRKLMSMALRQIVDNAVRYSAPGTRITIAGDLSASEMQVRVRNLGSSVPAEERTKIFERYYRAPGSSERANGTGLGLAVTKQIVEAHEGRVWVSSDGESTTFTLALPRDSRRNGAGGKKP